VNPFIERVRRFGEVRAFATGELCLRCKIIHNGVIVTSDFCGMVNSVGCDNNSDKSGLIKNFKFPINSNGR